ncbi:hypothetical protein AB4305_20120 [Nocardia sp. 2YAB30]|uniref:hypothetical protein n=1 Tax=unclassified Nocardia TaxID=2637762 RepID=UPI003F9E44BF
MTRYGRERRPRAQMVATQSRRIGVVAQLSFAPAAEIHTTPVRVLPASAQMKSLAPMWVWTCNQLLRVMPL